MQVKPDPSDADKARLGDAVWEGILVRSNQTKRGAKLSSPDRSKNETNLLAPYDEPSLPRVAHSTPFERRYYGCC